MFEFEAAQVRHLNLLKKYGRSSSKTNVVVGAAPASLMLRDFVGAGKAGMAPACALPRPTMARRLRTIPQQRQGHRQKIDLLSPLQTFF